MSTTNSRTAPRFYYPFAAMHVGDSFLVQDRDYRQVYQAVWMHNKRATNGVKFVTQLDLEVFDATRVTRVK